VRISQIDFPESLLASQKQGCLAVFAGAGVSIPPPSNYPDFKDLANRVAGGDLVLPPDEPIDRFLGRLADRGTKVHQMVGKILTNPDSKPTSLHTDLLGLFRSSDAIRLVTTNFDPHFSTAARLTFPDGEPCETHYAPALPLGDSFTGIVYLHGGVEKPFERLVLTDADFGRAYLTEGWARVFLQKLFERYTVLFVGYSHNDPVMNYLARGLPATAAAKNRFALTVPGQEDNWTYRGIIPIIYKLATDGDRHAALPAAISAWSNQARLGLLEQEQRIKSIVELPPPIDPEESDYIEAALSELATTRFFTRHAKTVAWLKWVEDKKLLRRLFDPRATITEVDRELAGWFAEQFQCQYVGESLSVLRRQGDFLSPFFWSEIAHKLFRATSNGLSAETVRRWLAVLLNDPPPGANTDLLEMIAANLAFPDDTAAAILLFDHLSRPEFHLENDFWSEIQELDRHEDVKFEIATNGGGFWLDHFWTRFLLPNLAHLIDRLEPIITAHLQRVYWLGQADDQTDPPHDALTFSRDMIEQHDHGQRHKGLGVLIDAAFDVAKWNVEHRPQRADALIDSWLTADSYLLKRLGILTVSMCSHWTGDSKLAWLLAHDLLYKFGLKHEVFQVLQGAFPLASQDSRKRVIERALRGPEPVREGAEETAAYETYNLIYWLYQSEPKCALAKAGLDTLQTAHPAFGKRGHPDLDIVTSGPVWVGSQSPATAEDLLAKAPKDQVEYLLSFVGETPFGPSRDGLLQTVAEATTRRFAWGRELAAELEAREVWTADLWSSIILGWSKAELSDEQWKELLTFLNGAEKLHLPSVDDLASLLQEAMKRSSHPIPGAYLPIAFDLSKKLWVVTVAQAGAMPPKLKLKEAEWLALAINHPAGNITLFWLAWLGRERKAGGDSWQGIPQHTRGVLESVLSEPAYAGELGRVLLASQINLLMTVDEAWAKEKALPLFDWSLDDKRAVQAFHGFLTWGRQTESLVPYLVPLYEKAFAHMAMLGRLRDRFAEYLAGLAFASSVNPMTQGWLNRFVAASAREDRISWASHVRRVLRPLTAEAKQTAWISWIKPYWAQRIPGAPLPLDREELGEMVEWSLHLGPSFPEVVDAVWESPGFELKHSSLFRELDDSQFPEKYPSAAAKLLLKVLCNTPIPDYDLDRVEDVVRRVAPLAAPLDFLEKICNELARLGYPPAAELQAWLRR
jgi:hypothetical protein